MLLDGEGGVWLLDRERSVQLLGDTARMLLDREGGAWWLGDTARMMLDGERGACWYYGGPIWRPYKLSIVHIGRRVDHVSKVSQSTNFCSSISVCVDAAIHHQVMKVSLMMVKLCWS